MAKSAKKYVYPGDWDVVIDAWKMPDDGYNTITRADLLERIDVASALGKIVALSRDVVDGNDAIQFSLIPTQIEVK